MSKSCSWITNNTGEIIGALTEDSKKSKLFENLLKQYDVQQAQDLYEASRSDAFKEIYGEVTTLSFEDFVDSKSDFRDAHSAPSKDTTPTKDKLDSGGDFSLLEVSKGFHNQPDDYFDPQVGARYYGYNTKEGKQSFTAISNIIRGVKTGKENQTITTYRAVPKGVDVDTLQDYDWVSFSKDYTKSHGNSRFGLKEFKIIEQEVPITDLWWDGNDINEWGYDTGNTEKLSRRDLKNLWDNMQEATPEQVVRFVTEENQSKRELSAEQKVAVRNFGVANTENLKERLLDTFYDNEGVFFVSESKLVQSGLYSAYEASNLKNDISLQEKVKSALEAFKNTSEVYSEDISDDQVDKINTFNSFGKLVKVKKQVEPLQSVETFQEIDGQLVEEPVDNVDLLLSYKSAEENQELEDDLNVLLPVSDEVLLRNEATKTVLENVERLAIADGLDLIGLADKQFDRPFMQSLLDFVISPNKENTANFSQEYKRLFQKNSEVKLTGLNREVDNKEYVVVNTTLSEQEVYKQKGCIKVEDNLYIKTNSQPLEELYEVVRTYTEKYPKEMTLEQYVQQETGKLQGFTNPEIAEAVVLYKMYFEGVNEGVNQISEGVIGILKATNLAKNVYQLSNQEIENKLTELGVDTDVARQVVAYHGSPYSFNRFTTEKMGTGEGAQAFGWGLYFTDLESIAKNYAEKLSDVTFEGKPYGNDNVGLANATILLVRDAGSVEKALENLNKLIGEKGGSERSLSLLEFLTANSDKYNVKKNLYKVSLHKGKTPSEYTWLEWDKPLSQRAKKIFQTVSDSVRDKYKIVKDEYNNYFVEDKGGYRYSTAYTERAFAEDYINGEVEKVLETGEKAYNALTSLLKGDKEASLFLLKNGIDGIKYPAESISRGATSDTARGFNYVVFDENAITIEEQLQFQKVDVTTNGFIHSGNVYLNSDSISLDTPIHEFNHLYNNWLKENRNDVYKVGLNLIEKELNNPNSEIKGVIDFVKKNQPNLTGEKLQEEILTELVGRRGLELIDSNSKSGIIGWIKEAWKNIKNMLGLSNYTDRQIVKMNLREFTTASSVDLLKGQTIAEQVTNFTGNYEYLTEDFPADFYKEMLAEKKKDSVKYNNYYVHFGIDEKGIYLNEVDSNTLENIKDFADENMKQYSVISKRIPNIADQTEEVFSTEQTRRDEAINNPNSVEKFTGEYVKTASDNVIAKNTQKEFIKVENEIYELWDDLGNLSMYTKVGQNTSQYSAVNTKKTGTNEDLNSYTHLLTTPEKFINYKKNNEVEGFEC